MKKVRTPQKCLSARTKWQALLLFLFLSAHSHAQKIATLEISLDHPSAGIQVPVQLLLDPVTRVPDAALRLVEVQGKKRIPVPFQVETGTQRTLTWLVSDDQKTRVYELLNGGSEVADAPGIETVKKDGTLTIRKGSQNLLRYQYKAMYPPKGVDSVFKRSAFIHPLWAPHGQVLTRVQPPDHYHHYGIWNPWTHVLYEGDTVDFWNLSAKQGTVRFADFVSITSGNVFGQYAALHEHIAFDKKKKEKVALREVQTVKVFAPQDPDCYIADITVEMRCPESPVRLLEYRYGGMGWRATEEWTNTNSAVLTSEGKTRKDADGSRARWCIVQGQTGGETAGVVMMSYPLNYNYPEPLRIWPENANRNRGDMFANFSPTKNMDWLLKPGSNYVLKYRFIVFNGTFTDKKAEAAWHYFASPPLVKVVRTKTR